MNGTRVIKGDGLRNLLHASVPRQSAVALTVHLKWKGSLSRSCWSGCVLTENELPPMSGDVRFPNVHGPAKSTLAWYSFKQSLKMVLHCPGHRPEVLATPPQQPPSSSSRPGLSMPSTWSSKNPEPRTAGNPRHSQRRTARRAMPAASRRGPTPSWAGRPVSGPVAWRPAARFVRTCQGPNRWQSSLRGGDSEGHGVGCRTGRGRRATGAAIAAAVCRGGIPPGGPAMAEGEGGPHASAGTPSRSPLSPEPPLGTGSGAYGGLQLRGGVPASRLDTGVVERGLHRKGCHSNDDPRGVERRTSGDAFSVSLFQ